MADTWGYTYNGFYTVYLIDETPVYREATLKVLSNIDRYTNYRWEGDSADGYADSIESGLNLYNREPLPSVAGWIDSEIKVMWRKQKESGIIEGWHGDGNFARTTIMYSLWKTQGTQIQPWRSDVVYGAILKGDSLIVQIESKTPWKGQLILDKPRHKEVMKLPLDWPRINQFPEWFVVDNDKIYLLRNQDGELLKEVTGEQLTDGIPIDIQDELPVQLIITPKPTS